MDIDLLLQSQHAHQHEGGRRSERAFPVMLIVAFLVLSACAAFAVIMTNGPDGRAAAEPIPTPTLSGGVGLAVGPGADKTVEHLTFGVAMPGGPVVIGEPGRLVVTVANPHSHAVVLESLGVTVGDPNGGCRPEWLSVGRYPEGAEPVTIPAGGSARVSVSYELLDLAGVNQDACKGAEFPLTISGTGRPV